ncbi:efflux RND transporter permease subunit [Methylobacterium oryzae CBMB20]
MQVVGFHGYPSIEIFGGGAPGEASGDPVAVMERPATRSSPGFDVVRTGPSLREKRLGRRAVDLLVLALLRVFLGVAAPSGSRAVPPAVLLAVPTGVVGAIFETLVRGVPNDVQFKVGLITVIGLTAKTAILIIEEAGKPWRRAETCSKRRWRPAGRASGRSSWPLSRSSSARSPRRRHREQPAGDRHGRARRDDHRDGARRVLGARAAPDPPGGGAPAVSIAGLAPAAP